MTLWVLYILVMFIVQCVWTAQSYQTYSDSREGEYLLQDSHQEGKWVICIQVKKDATSESKPWVICTVLREKGI